MGSYYTYGATKQDVIAEQTQGWETDKVKVEAIDKALVGNDLWVLFKPTLKDDSVPVDAPMDAWIGFFKLLSSKDGWGYKPMDESMHPYFYTCPLRFLDKAPVPESECAKGWRDKVRAYHAEREAKKAASKARGAIEVGKFYRMVNVANRFKGKAVQIVRIDRTGRTGKGRRYYGDVNGWTYRIRSTQIGEEVSGAVLLTSVSVVC